MNRWVAMLLLGGLLFPAAAEPPDIEYIYPAGGQRGSVVPVRVGGYYFHGQAGFEMLGPGVQFKSLVPRVDTTWFEGPLIFQPLSQRGEDYPKDHANEIILAAAAPLGDRYWRCWTSQGATRALRFVVGNLPEVIEEEIDGRPLPQAVTLPVTANGRIFPREDIDVWTLEAKAGDVIVCDAAAKRFGSPVNLVLSVQDPTGRPLPTQHTVRDGDPVHWFRAPTTGRYAVSLRDAKFWGQQNHIYRLTLTRGPRILHTYPLGAQRGTTVSAEVHGPDLKPRAVSLAIPAHAGDSFVASIEQLGEATFVLSDHPERLEPTPEPATVPVVLNGRILKPGEMDEWTLQLDEKQAITLDLAAASLGSPLDASLSIHDAEGKQLATNDDRAAGQPDPILSFTAPKAGAYTVRVRDRFRSRGGPSFAYRLTAAPAARPDFKLTLAAAHYNVTRDPDGGLADNRAEIEQLEQRIAEIDAELKAAKAIQKTDPTAAARIRDLSAEKRTATATVRKLKAEDAKRRPKFKVALGRLGGFKGEVRLAFKGLPKNVTVLSDLIEANGKEANLEFIAPASTTIDVHRLSVTGTGDLGDRNATRAAVTPEGLDHLLLGVVPIVPFKHEGVYRIITAMPGGSTFQREYALHRNGFEGPLKVRLADKQIRHLQGVTDQIITVESGRESFKYPYRFPARVEVGRTSRLQVMLIGELTDFDGSKHLISYTSRERNDQLISVAAQGNVSVEPATGSLALGPNESRELTVKVGRANAALGQALLLGLRVPRHMRDVKCETVRLEPSQTTAILRLQTGPNPGPFNQTVILRASTAGGPRQVGEALLELVAPLK
jgi:hypothetical protein